MIKFLNINEKIFKHKKNLFKIISSTILIIAILATITFMKTNLSTKNDISKSNSKTKSMSLTSDKYSKFTIVLDPGHGGYDNGCNTDSNVFEKDITLQVAQKSGEILENNGVNVIYTRIDDNVSWPANNYLDLKSRNKISSDANADAFISIHCNSSDTPDANGIETWCRFPNSEGEALAKNIQNELVNANYSHDRGLRYESEGSLGVLKYNKTSTSTLVELGFLSNPSDASFLTSKIGQDTCAKAIANGILNYLSSLLD